MRNMEQIRAAHALEWADRIGRGRDNGEVVKKIPPLIINNGILATIAFALESTPRGYKNAGHHSVFEAIVNHLVTNTHRGTFGNGTTTVEIFMKKTASCDASTLRSITAESLAYLNYLRRFVKGNANA